MSTKKHGDFQDCNGTVYVSNAWTEDGNYQPCVSRFYEIGDPNLDNYELGWAAVPVAIAMKDLAERGLKLASRDSKIARMIRDGDFEVSKAKKAAAVGTQASSPPPIAPPAPTRTIKDIERDSAAIAAEQVRRAALDEVRRKAAAEAEGKANWARIVAKHGGKAA
jgi:hypothetical protein